MSEPVSEYPEFLSSEAETAAFYAWTRNNSWDAPEYVGIAQGVLLHVAARLKGFAVERFDRYGFRDARGAAFWDAAAFVDEQLVGDPLTRRLAAEHRETA